MRLIDADALKPISASFDGKIIFIVTLNEIRNAPTVNSEPTRYGHWIRHDDELLGLTEECSECHCEGMVHGNYCPNCGADMREQRPAQDEYVCLINGAPCNECRPCCDSKKQKRGEEC